MEQWLSVAWGIAFNASAVINDEPYFQLFPGAPYDFNTETSPGAALGHPSSVSICGTSNCAITQETMIVDVARIQPAGTGYRYSYLRLNEPGTGTDKSLDGTDPMTESAYNTDYSPLQNDSDFTNDAQDDPKQGNDWNRALLVSDLKEVNGYYEILLDINEKGSGSGGEYIKLDEFEIHLSTDGLLGNYNPNDPGQGSFSDSGYAGIVFDMDWWLSQAAETPTVDNTGTRSVTAGGLILKNCAGTTIDSKGKCGSGDEDYVFRVSGESLR